MTDLKAKEAAFQEAMLEIYRRAKAECEYNAIRFLQMVTDFGGVETAKKLLLSDDIQYGFTKLWECGCLSLTVEAHVLLPEFRHFFTREMQRRARDRLLAHDPHFFDHWKEQH
ncbi:hypothetical protein HKBW3S03_00604 [Candidatus Hakubella thermalkaliphila]|uniref:Uncharacterized protein n=2 Tax=Candidatus Hakubella thermalkaliphila TaxID=2754717 RepID=A0A6V8PA49_9ACTN|nr:hypothetical protein [Candidatus Hakubella thermalkaliphila]MBT9168620.1 hypothetical protein [Bacillota bacterium]MBT9170566.1 hypothetical protein [Actinomycetota bacterium]GFP19100.1 hypothetical protein HKBW3S03_00604 [Candidatus Hakubella thermalkaliphila]GFP29562.1 hypothetical protein HKBW3S34_00482 [Candidatus Hakubella thermalkaliphila]GFP39968.1 hypothetical protein HKBW3S47_01665 [Candidatus Hakubella thermalkaliphila]